MSLTDQEAFGYAVRREREQRGLSQEAFALLAGVHRTYVGGVERGERNISLKNIFCFARALGVPPSKLIEQAERAQASQKPRT